MLYADYSLAQRLERTEARSNAAFVETRAHRQPAVGATWCQVGGTYAMFDGPASPLTQTFGLGMAGPVGAAELAEIERFFQSRGAPVLHEVSPLADPALLPLLVARGYHPLEYTSILFCPLPTVLRATAPAPSPPLSARPIYPAEELLWARISAAGWSSDRPELTDFLLNFGEVGAHCPGATPFLAELNGQPIAAGSLFIDADVALLAGASTVPAGRRQGAQSALLAARLGYAAARGCTVAMMGALPGSQSQRNAETQGFRLAYTRTKWLLPG